MSTVTANCYHCAEAVPAGTQWSVEFGGESRVMCCPGCQAVMQAIVDAGLGDYYRFRTGPADAAAVPEKLAGALQPALLPDADPSQVGEKATITDSAWAVYDEPEFAERYLQKITGTLDNKNSRPVQVMLAVDGMRCGACVWLLERAVNALDGVQSAQFNYSTSRARVEFDSARMSLSQLLQRIATVGYHAAPFDSKEREAALKQQSRVLVQRLFVAGIAMMQVMMYALPAYITESGDIDFSHEQLLRWASFVLTTPVMLFSAMPFFQGAWRDLRHRSVGMDVPVSIGLLAGFSASVVATLWGTGEIYFDSVSMFVFLLLLARYLEWTARCRAMRAIDAVGAEVPETAWLLPAESPVSAAAVSTQGKDLQEQGTGAPAPCPLDSISPIAVPAVRLNPGDFIRVDSGQRVPADATVLQGHGAIDTAILTGESLPVSVGPGEAVPGGALLAGSPLYMQVERRQSQSALSMIGSLVDRGASEKPRLVQLADQVAGRFVLVLLLFALAVFLFWLQADASRAAGIAIAVLVVSCPCALSLATPAALAAATAQLMKQHVLITRGHVLETAARVTDVVLDKTGTLTQGKPELVQLACSNGTNKTDVLALAARLEQGSAHPYSKAIMAGAQHVDNAGLGDAGWDPLAITSVEHTIGRGVSARYGNSQILRLGSADWCGLTDDMLASWQKQQAAVPVAPGSQVYLTVRDDSGQPASTSQCRIIAQLTFADALRLETAPLVTSLQKAGYRLHLLSGDQPEVVTGVASQLGITLARSASSPQDKQDYVKSLQANGATVMMIGDGVNDAPVLAAADVSMAVGDAGALACTAADTITLTPGLAGVLPLLGKARQTVRIVRQNLGWAIVYNVLAIPAAAIGLVPPWAAAIGMASSSLVVAGNALRLWSRADETSATQSTSGNSSDNPPDNPVDKEAYAWNH